MKKFQSILIGMLLHIGMLAQPICKIQHFSVDDGLSQSIVQRIIQDKKGFIWFSTWNGLDRYDGYSFRNYKVSSDESNPLTFNRITYIAETGNGNIWCQSYDGSAFIFDTNEEHFINVLTDLEKTLGQRLWVEKIISLGGGIAWILCKNGYFCRIQENLIKDGKGLELYTSSNSLLKGNTIYNVYKDSDNDEWILTDKGVTIIGKKQLDSDYPFKLACEYNEHVYLVASSDKLATYDMKTGKLHFSKYPFQAGKISKVEPIATDTLALTTTNGLALYLTKEDRFIQIDIGTPGEASNAVRNLYKDSYGDCWIIPCNSGVIRLNLHTLEKKYYSVKDAKGISYERKATTFFYEDSNGGVWILPDDGHLCYYNRETDNLSYYQQRIGTFSSIYDPLIRYCMTDRQGNMWLVLNYGLDKVMLLPYNFQWHDIDYGVELRSFLVDKSQKLWVGSKTGIIRIYTPEGKFIGYLSEEGKITPSKTPFSSGVYCIFEDNKGNIWIGTKNDGISVLSKQNEGQYKVLHYQHEKNNPYSLTANSVVSVFQDSKQRIWIACYGGGINLVSTNKDGSLSFVNYNNEMKSYPVEIALKTRCITESKNGAILIGTTNGLLSFSSDFNQPEEIRFFHNKRRINDGSSLHSNDVMHILTDKKGNTYLLSFTGGISRVLSSNLLTDTIRMKTYTKKEGLVSELVQSAVEDAKGNIWIIQEDAISKFNPSTERFENYRNTLFMSDLKFSEAVPVINAKGNLIAGTTCGMLEFDINRISKPEYIPPIVFTGIMVQGDKKATLSDRGNKLDLKPEERNITFQFAAIDYIGSKDIQYAYRLKGLEKEWNYADNTRSARYMNIPAGTYEFEVKSTNSDGVWMDNTRHLVVIVQPQFYETIWAWILYVLLFLLFTGVVVYILFYIYRLRHRIDVEHQLADIKLHFFTDISHELRTPLTLISSPLSEVLSHEKLSAKARENLLIVEKNAQRMLRMMNQILDFRKIQKGKMKIFLERVNIIESIRSVLESFSSLAFDKQIQVSLDTKVSDLYIWTDSDKFDKIFFNLVSNAFKYTPNGKKITIRIKETEGQVCLTVEDEGVGIDKTALKTIFQRFETLGTFTAMQPSSGIGLSLVKDLINMLHGNITVESQIDKGSRFIVTLPIDLHAYDNDRAVELLLKDNANTDNEIMADSIENIEEKEESEDSTTILIVEDNAEMRIFLNNILSEHYKILTAENGKQGLTTARESIPDMILTDVMMPIMDGLDMVKHLKEDPDTCHIPIIILSAKSSLDDRIEALEQGIDDYLTKPFSATYLKTRIATLFKQRKQLQELYLSRLSGNRKDNTFKTPMEPEPVQQTVMQMDEIFMQKVMDFLEKNMDNQELEIEDFASHLCLSRTVFYRKLKSIVGLTPVEFVREIRIKRAVQLIENSDYTFSQIAYMTGFNDPKYFGKCFKKIIGVTPTEYKVNKEI